MQVRPRSASVSRIGRIGIGNLLLGLGSVGIRGCLLGPRERRGDPGPTAGTRARKARMRPVQPGWRSTRVRAAGPPPLAPAPGSGSGGGAGAACRKLLGGPPPAPRDRRPAGPLAPASPAPTKRARPRRPARHRGQEPRAEPLHRIGLDLRRSVNQGDRPDHAVGQAQIGSVSLPGATGCTPR